MKNRMLKQLGVAVVSAGMVFAAGCASVMKAGSTVGVAAGVITPQQGESLTSAFKGFTPENEHYLGRAVGATILQKFSVYENEAANHYVRLVGQACAQASDMPVTFGGYTFQILDSDEVNAFAAPGGFIFVTRGMLRLCRNEDDLAAVLAHEVAHVQLKHGVNAISRGRTLEAGRILVSVGLNQFGSANVVNSLEQLNKLTEVFGGSVGDIVTSLMLKGYSREQEYEADKVAITIMERLGYDPAALTRVLDRMGEKVHKGGPGFGSTHPPPADRVKAAGKRITAKQAAESAVRAKRFAKAMQGV
ncbi:MAG TPA: M48 family metalloprotease [Kiritimatiellia bacterium]|nr:M48 family metalloprotease [Kiritimatiellia bacterium]